MREFYNTPDKEEFLNTHIPKSTKESYGRVLEKAKSLEDEFEKDLYDFNIRELKSLFGDLEPLTPHASRTSARIVSSYINWAIDMKKKINQINPLKNISVKWYDQFVKDQDKIYISESELVYIEEYCNNAQDAVIFRLLFEGVQGEGCAELSNLHKKYIDFSNNIIRIFDKDDTEGRILSVSHKTIRLIERALKQKRYLKRNGEMEGETDLLDDEVDLAQNDYVLRNSITRRKKYLQGVDKHTIYRRITTIRDLSGFPYLTVKNIVKSGAIKMGRDLYIEYGELGADQLQKIADRFNMNNLWYIKDFVNLENIERVYGVDFFNKKESKSLVLFS